MMSAEQPNNSVESLVWKYLANRRLLANSGVRPQRLCGSTKKVELEALDGFAWTQRLQQISAWRLTLSASWYRRGCLQAPRLALAKTDE